jgi:hypothetical protein
VIGAWVFDGIALRLAGALIALAGLLGLSLGGDAGGALVFALGVCLCLPADLHLRLRHGYSKSAVAEWLCLAIASACRRALAIAFSDRRR